MTVSVWEHFTNKEPYSNSRPCYHARKIRLQNGNTIISDQFNDRIIIVDQDKNIVDSDGNLNQPGIGTDNT